jgi:uncharacterized protein YqeY
MAGNSRLCRKSYAARAAGRNPYNARVSGFTLFVPVTLKVCHSERSERPAVIQFRTCNLENEVMSLFENIQKDMIAAMKARQEQRLSTLRMVVSALKNRQIEKRAPVDDRETMQVLQTLIKQRKDSIEQFTRGGRQDLADKEQAEVGIIEAYLPKAAGEEEVVAAVRAVIGEMGAVTAKDVGTVMKNVMARFAASGQRVDGKQVNEIVRRELAGK